MMRGQLPAPGQRFGQTPQSDMGDGGVHIATDEIEYYLKWRGISQMLMEPIDNKFAGFSTSGELRLICAAGERRLSAGEIEA